MAAALKLNLKLNSAGQSLKFGDEGIQWNLRVACIAVLNDEEWSSLPAGPPAASSARRISTPRRSPSPGWFREVPLDNCIHEASQNHRPGTMNRWWLDYSTFLPAILNDEPIIVLEVSSKGFYFYQQNKHKSLLPFSALYLRASSNFSFDLLPLPAINTSNQHWPIEYH